MHIAEREFRTRVAKCHDLMEREGYAALVAYASHIQYGSVRYLTGYEPWLAPEEWAFAVVAPGYGAELSLLSNSPWDFMDFNRRDSTWVDDVVVGSNWVEELSSRIPPIARRVGIMGWAGFPARVYVGLKERFPATEFVDASKLLADLRAIKSPAEIAALRKVGELSDIAGRAFFEAAKPGATERDVVAHVDAAVMRGGAEQMAYFTILGSGPKTVASCFLPTDRVLAEGEIVQMDVGPMYDGYKGDFSRLVIVGKSRPAAALRLVETVAETHDRCAAMLRPGVRCAEIAQAGLDVYTRNGYTRDNLFKSANFPGLVFMGHGIGLENPDPPGMMTLTSEAVLQEGMVINLEPILLAPGLGGGRIETSFVVTKNGPDPLSSCGIRPWLDS
jgi:Xaa-Pro aminopeptidase